MNRFLPLILLLLAGLAAILFLLPEADEADGTDGTDGAEAHATDGDPEAGTHAGGSSGTTPNPEAGSYDGVSRDSVAEEGLATDGGTSVTIHYVDGAGAPIRDLEVRVSERPDFDQDLGFAVSFAPFNQTKEVDGPVYVSDAQGKAVVPIVPGSGATLVATGDYWEKSQIRLQALREGEQVDLGIQTLRSAARLQGQVLNTEGKPLGGAQINLREDGGSGFSMDRLRAETDADGHYFIGGLAAGNYRLTASGPGHAAQTVPGLEIRAGDHDVNEDFRLDAGRRAHGVIVDQDRNPIAGAELWVQNNRRVFWPDSGGRPKGDAGATSDRSGRFYLDGLPPQDGARILVWSEGYAIGSTLFEKEDEELLVTLSRHSQFTGRLLAPGGAPLAGQELRLRPADQDDWRSWMRTETTTTNLEGKFEFTTVEPGLYNVEASTPEASLLDTQIDLAVDQLNTDLHLRSVPVLVVTVVDDEGSPVSGARVGLQRKQESGGQGVSGSFSISIDSSVDGVRTSMGGGETGRTDVSGRAWFPELAEGVYTLKVVADGKATIEQDLVRGRGPQQEDLTLYPGADLRVQVQDGQGNPLAGVEVALHDVTTGHERTRKSDRTGRAWWDGLAAGPYVVQARASALSMMGSASIFQMIGGPEAEKPAPTGETVDLREGDQADLVLTVKDLAIPEILVLRGDKPVGGADVRLQSKQPEGLSGFGNMHIMGGPGGGQPTGADGKVQLDPVKPGAYELVVRASPTSPEVREDVDLHAGKQLVELHVRGGTIEGKVLGSNGPLAGARVNLQHAPKEGETSNIRQQTMIFALSGPDGEVIEMGGSSGGELASVRTDADGGYRFEDVPAGDWIVVVRATDYSEARSDQIVVGDHGSTDAGVVRLVQGGRIEGRLPTAEEDPNNPFPMGSFVQLNSVDGKTHESAMGRNGRYSFRDLEPGKYRVTVGEYESPALTVRAGETVTHHID